MQIETATSYPPINGRWEPLLTPIEAGQLLRCHAKTVLKLAREHKLPAIRLGRHWRLRVCDLLAWVTSEIQPIQAEPPDANAKILVVEPT